MRYYIASRLDNQKAVWDLKAELDQWGWTHTYDWTQHGSLQTQPEEWQRVAGLELEGVMSAHVVVVLLPGGRGTHVELGAALVSWKHVAVVGVDPQAPYECLFHYHPLVKRFEDVEGLRPWLLGLPPPAVRPGLFPTETEFLRYRMTQLQDCNNEYLKQLRGVP